MFFEIILLIISLQTIDTFDFSPSDYQPRNFVNCFENLGCIEITEEWYDEKYRPINLEPLDRHTIRTEFILIKKRNKTPELFYDILTTKQETIEISGFKKGGNVILLIHDFTSNGYTGWIKHMALVIQTKNINNNVISVDWEGGAEPPYDQAIANARVVALESIAFLRTLKKFYKINENQIHLIGHGIGAHIAGYIGKNVTGIGRITGLDPNGPRFTHMPHKVRLCPRDAKFVEVIHTDAYNENSQGLRDKLGHVDFYINNAGFQPNCKECSDGQRVIDIDRGSMKEGKIIPGCSHKRAFKYFIESIDNADCKFLGIKCSNYQEFLEGKCHTCQTNPNGVNSCAEFGLESSPIYTTNNTYFVNTRGDPPFCMQSYVISIKIGPTGKSKTGKFEMILISEGNEVSNISTIDSNTKLRTLDPGKQYTFIFYSSPPQLIHIKEAKVKWIHVASISCFVFCEEEIYVDQIIISPLIMGKETFINYLCPIKNMNKLVNGGYITYAKCGSAVNYLVGVNKPSFSGITPSDYEDLNQSVNNTHEDTFKKDHKNEIF